MGRAPFPALALLLAATDAPAGVGSREPAADSRKTHHLAVFSTNQSKRTWSLALVTDENDEIVALRTLSSRKNRVRRYDRSILDEEINLTRKLGVRLATLRCHDLDPSAGCPITIKYPGNIALGRFRRFRGEIRKRDGEWGCFSEDGTRFAEAKLIVKKILGIPVGIKRIELR